jgi:hypothetical protein
MPVPTVGDRVKVVERATGSDTKVVTEGVVTAVDEANNRLDFDITKTKVADTANVNVRVEIQAPPLPTTPGSVLRAAGHTLILATDGRWWDETSNAWPTTVVVDNKPDVLLDTAEA